MKISVESKFDIGDKVYVLEKRDHFMDQPCKECDGAIYATFPNGHKLRCGYCQGTGRSSKIVGPVYGISGAECEVLAIHAVASADGKTKVRYRLRVSEKVDGRWKTKEVTHFQHDVYSHAEALEAVTVKNQAVLDFPLDP